MPAETAGCRDRPGRVAARTTQAATRHEAPPQQTLPAVRASPSACRDRRWSVPADAGQHRLDLRARCARPVARPARIADGDLTQPHRLDAAATKLGDLLRALAAMQDALRRMVGQVRAVDRQHRSRASAEIATGNADLCQRTEQTAQQPAADRQLDGAAHRHRASQSADSAAPGQPARQLRPPKWPQRGGDVVVAGRVARWTRSTPARRRSPTSSA